MQLFKGVSLTDLIGHGIGGDIMHHDGQTAARELRIIFQAAIHNEIADSTDQGRTFEIAVYP